MPQMLAGAFGGQSPLLKWVDIEEQYGAHVVRRMLATIPHVDTVLDLGAGEGRDLNIARDLFPAARLHGVEFAPEQCATLRARNIHTYQVDLEREALPFADHSLDLVIVNQVLEHIKDIFWLLHEVSRVLAPNGHLLVGVPNVAALHNRLLLLLGRHPTQAKAYSAHVRTFSFRDTKVLFDVAGGGAYRLEAFAGAQFYPLPRRLARLAAGAFPAMAFSIFFLFTKQGPYTDAFVRHGRALTASNFCPGA